MKKQKHLIIVEGVDGAGKSTFVQHVTERLERAGRTVESIHRGPIPEGRTWRQEYVEDPLEALERADVVIMDRSYPSEVVYGDVFRNGTTATVHDWYHLHFHLLRKPGLKVTKIYLYAPLDVLKSRLASRGDDEHIVEHLADLTSRYHYWVSPHDGWVHFDTSRQLDPWEVLRLG